MDSVFQRLGISDKDLVETRELVKFYRSGEFGEKFAKYLNQVFIELLDIFPPAKEIPSTELFDIVSVTYLIVPDSRAIMKRLKAACNGCGFCCSQTQRIVVTENDTIRISRELRQKRDDLFIDTGTDWLIKKSHPCMWWNRQNGRCLIYNIRPQTCRVWPLGQTSTGKKAIQPVAVCSYAVMLLVNKVVWVLENAQKP